jgi:hypothetical protein
VGFADGYQLLIASTASLAEVNRRQAAANPSAPPLRMDRFRPNIVVSGCLPFEEDTWKRIRIGSSTFRVVKGCSRCRVTTTDQVTGVAGATLGPDGVTPEPLATLSTFRAVGPEVYFGQNLIHEPPSLVTHLVGWLRGAHTQPIVCADDPVVVLERGDPTWDASAVRAAPGGVAPKLGEGGALVASF